MAKNIFLPPEDEDPLPIEVESWHWESKSQKITWKQGITILLLLVGMILFAFGFLVVAGIMLVVGMVVGLVLFLIRKLGE